MEVMIGLIIAVTTIVAVIAVLIALRKRTAKQKDRVNDEGMLVI